MLQDDFAGHVHARRAQSIVVFKFDRGLEPELGFTSGVLDMDVWPRLLT